MINKQQVEKILKKYEEAWVEQDVDKILDLFTKDAIYHEKVLEEPIRGHKGIKQYWESKVCKEQSDIDFKLLNYYICDNTLIAEWDAQFNSSVKNIRIHIQEVAIMEIENDKIKSLREYWHSEKKIF